MKKALVCGAGGFIGSHLVKKLKNDGYWVRGVDLKKPEYSESPADEFLVLDISNPNNAYFAVCLPQQEPFDEVYQLAADMGGAGYIFSGDNDAMVMTNSALINLNMLKQCHYWKAKKIFFSSSACVYPEFNQTSLLYPKTEESSAYPAQPDSEYGWEKIFSERLYTAYHRNFGMDIRIARFHNIFGPEGSWNNGKEKSPAALCRKVAEAKSGDKIEVWGDGYQTRSFLYIDECLEGVQKLMESDYTGPVNIGSDEMISLNNLAQLIIDISHKKVSIKNVSSNALGVRGRTSDNNLALKKLNWKPNQALSSGIKKLYVWINQQIKYPNL